ncbi:MAG: DNA primase [Acidobacteriota bacterium]
MDLIEKIKAISDIVEIASNYTTLKRSGRRYVGLCPFHSEKTPSFTVDQEKSLYHCFGCGAGGDVFTLIVEKEKLSFTEAVEFLAKKYNIPLEKKAGYSGLKKLEDDILKINSQALKLFQNTLFNSAEGKEALKYLEKRGISKNTIEEFQIGYASKNPYFLVNIFKKMSTPMDLLLKSGLIVPASNDYMDRFKGRIIFPIKNEIGNVVGFGGRAISEENPKYLNSPETPLYSKRRNLFRLDLAKKAIKEKEYVILVEGYFDLISIYSNGFKNALASLGTSLTPEQVSLIKRFTDKIYVCYDRDEAGVQATIRALPIIFEIGLIPRIILIEEGTDPDKFINKYGAGEFKKAIENSVSSIEFLMKHSFNYKNSDSLEKRISIIRKVLEIIEKIPDWLLRGEYIKELSSYSSIDEETLMMYFKEKRNRDSVLKKQDEITYAEKIIISTAILNKDNSGEIIKKISEMNLDNFKSKEILKAIISVFEKNRTLDISQINELLDKDSKDILYNLLLSEDKIEQSENINECFLILQRMILENNLKEIQRKIKECELRKDKNSLLSLLNLKQEITKKIINLSNKKEVNH